MGEQQRVSAENFASWLALAGNTDDVIDWEKLRSRSAEVEALDRRDRCKLLLSIANGRAIPSVQWNQLVGVPVLKGNGIGVPLNAARAKWLGDQLAQFLAGNKQERISMFERLRDVAHAHTFLGPFDPTSANAERPLVAQNVSAGLVYGLQIVFDPKDEFASKLSRCQFSECNSFFFDRPARGGVGRRNTRYCSAAHVKAGVREQARLRMAKLRRKVK